MRHPDQPTNLHSPDWGRKLTAAGVAGTVLLGSLVGLGKDQSFDAEASIRPAATHNIQPGSALPDIGHDLPTAADLLALAGTTQSKTEAMASAARNELLQNEAVPQEVQKLIRYNAAKIEGVGSAWLLRDKHNDVIGAELVAHEGFLPNQADRYEVDGKNYIVVHKPLELKIGNHYDKTVGVLDKVMAPNDYVNENLVAAVKGHSLQEAYKIAMSQRMTRQEMSEMKVGDAVYFAGDPSFAAKKGRHTNVGHVLTFGFANSSAGTHNINTLWVSNTANKDGSQPGPGFSGAGVIGRVNSTGQYKMLGNDFGMEDFSGQLVVEPSESGNTTIHLKDAITSASAIDVGKPVHGTKATELTIVRSKDQIKGIG